MNDPYQELSDLLDENQNLSSFFLKQHDYKKILEKAIYNQDESIISALNKHLPLHTWFNKDSIYNDFIESYKLEVFTASHYAWCMTMPEIRKHFTPEEKGKFVRIALAIENHKMAYHATLDHDWDAEIVNPTLNVELRRIARCSIKKFDGQHLQESYLHWIQEEIFPKISQKDQYFFLLGAFETAVQGIRQIAEIINLAKIDLNPSKKFPLEQISEVEQDLQDCVKLLKNQLCFDMWSDNIKDGFISLVTEVDVSASSTRHFNKEYLENLAEHLIPIINYSQLHNELKNTNKILEKKLKL